VRPSPPICSLSLSPPLSMRSSIFTCDAFSPVAILAPTTGCGEMPRRCSAIARDDDDEALSSIACLFLPSWSMLPVEPLSAEPLQTEPLTSPTPPPAPPPAAASSISAASSTSFEIFNAPITIFASGTLGFRFPFDLVLLLRRDSQDWARCSISTPREPEVAEAPEGREGERTELEPPPALK
jgi:hypothetical protein